MAVWTVNAECEPEDGIWFVRSSDMPGLLCDADTLPALERKISDILEDLIEINADELTPEQMQGPHTIRLIGYYEHRFDLAA